MAPSISEFCWEIACPTPWSSGALAYFEMDDPRLYMAVPTRIHLTVATQLSHFLRNFTFIQHYGGMRTSVHRISQLYRDHGEPENESWLKALLSVQMVIQGTNSLTTPFLYQFSQFSRDQTDAAVFTCDLSPLHGWALHEASDFFLRDLLLHLDSQRESPILHLPELTQQAQAVRSHFRSIADYLSGDKNPYFHLSELPIEDKA